jgi:hypothetical protein
VAQALGTSPRAQVEGENGPDWEFFGLADVHEPELGYFRLSDLQSFRGRFGLGIECDLYFSDHVLDLEAYPVVVVRDELQRNRAANL